MTINNPTENDYVLVRHYNDEYIRLIAWTIEEGGTETEHIQAYVKLMKQQRMSFIKKLFPRGHFRSITSDEYNRNCRDYAQKNDETTRSWHVVAYNEQIPDVVQFLRKMLEEASGCDPTNDNQPDTAELWMQHWFNPREVLNKVLEVEKRAVATRPSVAKLLVSPTYTRVKKLYLREIVENIVTTLYHNDADDNEGEGTGETDDEQSVTVSVISEEEEEGTEGESVESADTSDYEGSEGEDGD